MITHTLTHSYTYINTKQLIISTLGEINLALKCWVELLCKRRK